MAMTLGSAVHQTTLIPITNQSVTTSQKIQSHIQCSFKPTSGSFRKELTGARVSVSIQTSSTYSQRNVSVKVSASTGGPLPSLNDLPLISYISGQGRIVPPIEPNTQASVFAVFDTNKKIQYIGFSKDVRNSLRTLMGRRPELCYYYKIYNLSTLDQQAMLDIRKQWISELGLPPTGNSDPVQRNLWEKPGDAGSISERGKEAAAISRAKTLLQIMADRGLKEEMVYDPALFKQGKCDVLTSEGQTEDELAKEAAARAEATSTSRQVAVPAPNGDIVEFDLFVQNKITTNGGWMFDVLVNKDDKQTRHRVIVGKIYTDASGLNPEDFLDRVFGFLLHAKLPRHTEGVLTSDQFAVNYFAVSEVAQKFEEFKQWFNPAEKLPESYWRFNRIHTYGEERSPMINESKLFSPKY